MKYDPIKNILGTTIHRFPWLRILFYKLLGLIFLREWYIKCELKQQLGNRSKPFTVCDAGSGFGQYSYYIATKFPLATVYGIDLKEEQVADCNKFFRTVGLKQCIFAVEDLTQLQHSDEFDLILSVDVMEHIPDDVVVFRNFYRALKKSGLLLISTPSNIGGSDVHSKEGKSFIEEHARNGYAVDEICTKLESIGFAVEHIRYTYGHWGSHYWNIGIKYPMLMLNVSKLLFLLLPFYYLATFWIILPMMWLDYITDNKTGTGLNVLARKV
jgi:2-polyprenyl-3-methyl-5-hydroxy-6-metoxy-1,4-benzoquinol methylase